MANLPSQADALREFLELFQLLKAAAPDSPLLKRRGTVSGVVCFTSDSGFVGDLNSRLMREVLAHLPAAQRALFVVGAQGKKILREEEVAHESFPGIQNPKSYKEFSILQEVLLNWTFAPQNGSLTLVYPEYHSPTRQDLVQMRLFPFEEQGSSLSSRLTRDVMLEASLRQIEEKAASGWIRMHLKQAIWHVRLCELAARANHLEGSVEELSKQNRGLTLRYFRTLHEEMDTAVREVYASRQVLVGGP